MSNIAVYPGSFDPCTNGHLDIITRASGIFDKLFIAVLQNGTKTATFTIDDRINLLKKSTRNLKNIEVISFDGLLVELAENINAHVIIKGLRAMSDFESEFQMSLINKKLNRNIETIFMPTAQENLFLSSSVVREIAKYDGCLTGLVPDEIVQDVLDKLSCKLNLEGK